ncbi:MAG: RNA polymerase sigma factor [Planctomycetota bacterium]|jgi:RNA polymerase sigma-70 factor (ECF subfamily)
MNKSINLAKIVSRAQKGHKESLELLGVHVRQRVMVYLYRMTLDHHLAQDLTQETMLTIIRKLQHLRTDSHSSLWAWIYRTAYGKVQHYSQKQAKHNRKRQTFIDHDTLDKLPSHRTRDGLDHAQRKELIEAMGQSIGALKITYRHVLVLRCFEQLSFADIAEVLGTGSELKMRLLFFRAKQALKRQLHNRGFGRQYFLSGLSVFAIITSLRTKSIASAPAVTAGTVNAGAMATAIGTATTQGGIAILALLTIMFVVGPAYLRNSKTQASANQEFVPWNFPTRIINSYDPDGDGWGRLIPQDNGPDLQRPLVLSTIADRPGKNFFLILPEGHSVDFGFSGTLTNCPGPDIQFHCLKTDNMPVVFLTDGGVQTHQLENATRVLLMNWAYQVNFDLAGTNCPFTPTAIRIAGRGRLSQKTATILIDLKARVKTEN